MRRRGQQASRAARDPDPADYRVRGRDQEGWAVGPPVRGSARLQTETHALARVAPQPAPGHRCQDRRRNQHAQTNASLGQKPQQPHLLAGACQSLQQQDQNPHPRPDGLHRESLGAKQAALGGETGDNSQRDAASAGWRGLAQQDQPAPAIASFLRAGSAHEDEEQGGGSAEKHPRSGDGDKGTQSGQDAELPRRQAHSHVHALSSVGHKRGRILPQGLIISHNFCMRKLNRS